ncbi:MAG: sugar phosphate isomerase/epimerase family protein [Prolixibacteraceae bacterium]
MRNSIQSFVTFLVVLIAGSSCSSNALKSEKQPDLILSVNAYSFADLLAAKDNRNNEQVYTLFNLRDWCADHHIEALDPTAYFFPTYPEVPSDEYLAQFKNKASKLGIAISGTGIRNNFASPDSSIRAGGVQLAKNWMVAASKMGAPVLRVFAGEIPKGYEDNWEVPAGWMIECYKELIPFAEQYKVKIGIQNHGDMLQTAAQCKYILDSVDSEWAGLIVDTGNFKTDDPYKDIAEVVPYAFNWQVKESVFGIGNEIETDYNRLVQIVKDGGYKGYFPVETLLVRGKNYDPFQLVPNILDKLKKAMDEVY